MTISQAQTIKTANGNGVQTLSFTPSAAKNCIILTCLVAGSSSGSSTTTNVPNSVTDTGGQITWTRLGYFQHTTSPPNVGCMGMFLGVINGGAGTAVTITVNWNTSVSGSGTVSGEVSAHEFTSSVSCQWQLDGSLGTKYNSSSTSSTVTYPTLTPATTGEMYYGYGQVKNTASTSGQTSGYSVNSTATFGDQQLWNPNVTTTSAQSPTGTQSASGQSATIGALIRAVPGQTVTLAKAAETDSAKILSWAKTQALTFRRENDSAYQMSWLKTKVLGLATQSTTAYAITPKKSGAPIPLSTASETDRAYGFTWSKIQQFANAAQTTAAYVLGRLKVFPPIPRTTESDQAYPIRWSKSKQLPSASVTTRAYPIAVIKTYSLATAAQSTTTPTIGASTPHSVKLGAAQESDQAYAITPVKQYPVWQLSWWFRHRGQNPSYYSERTKDQG